MKEQSSEAPRTTYQAPMVEEIGQIHEVGERKVWELGTEANLQHQSETLTA